MLGLLYGDIAMESCNWTDVLSYKGANACVFDFSGDLRTDHSLVERCCFKECICSGSIALRRSRQLHVTSRAIAGFNTRGTDLSSTGSRLQYRLPLLGATSKAARR